MSYHTIPLRTSFGAAAILALSVTAGASHATGQQYVVDDAAIVDPGVCQVEAWHGRRASWILPACQAVRNLEIAVGVGFVASDDGFRETEYALEAKTLFRPLSPGDWGIGLVVGVGPNPSASERHLGDIYAFVPASLSLGDDRVVLHANLGWEWHRDAVDHGDHVHDEDEHQATWGARIDVGLFPRLSAIAEVSGEARHRPEFQTGFRLHLPEAGIEMDVSWGDHTERGVRGAGLTVGMQVVTGRIF